MELYSIWISACTSQLVVSLLAMSVMADGLDKQVNEQVNESYFLLVEGGPIQSLDHFVQG